MARFRLFFGNRTVAAADTSRPSRGGADYRKRYQRQPLTYDDKTRERAWQKAKEAEQSLRRSLDDLIHDRKDEAREIIADVQDSVQDVATELMAYPSFDGALEAINKLQADLARMVEGRMRQQQLEQALEQIRIVEMQLADDEEAIIAILMAGV